MQNKFGIDKVDDMIRRKSEIRSYKTYEIQDLILEYTIKADAEAKKR